MNKESINSATIDKQIEVYRKAGYKQVAVCDSTGKVFSISEKNTLLRRNEYYCKEDFKIVTIN